MQPQKTLLEIRCSEIVFEAIFGPPVPPLSLKSVQGNMKVIHTCTCWLHSISSTCQE